MPPPNVPVSLLPLLQPLSVDSGPDPDNNKFLEIMRKSNPTPLAHDTTNKAVINVLGVPQATLVSHGMPGIVNAGRGGIFTPPDATKSITVQSIPSVILLRSGRSGPTPLKQLLLFACNAGAGPLGAQLVFSLATALGAEVIAPIGAVGANRITFAPFFAEGEQFQRATPDMNAAPPSRDVLRLTPGKAIPQRLLLWADGEFRPLSVDAVRGLRVRARNAIGVETWSRQATPADARRAVRGVSFDRPLIFPGPLATLVTGRLFLTYVKAGREVTHEFLVHNNLLVEDTLAPGVFYEIDPASATNLA